MGEYTFGRDIYVYDLNCRKKISAYLPLAPEQEQNGIVGGRKHNDSKTNI